MQRLALAFLALLVVCSPALAQDAAAGAAAEHRQILTTNPLLLVGGYLNVEFERTVSESLTLGVTAATFDGFFDDDVRYSNVTAIARYYPQAGAPRGFFFGGKAGIHHVDVEDFFEDDQEETLVGLGFDLGYTWLLGKSDRFVLGLGGGASRLFGDELDGASVFLANARVNVGIAF